MSFQRAKGFTLVEVMVSITILSLVMLATVTGFRTMASAQSALNRTTERNDELRTVSTFLRDALGSAVMGSDTGAFSLGGDGSSGETAFFRTVSDGIVWKTVLVFGESLGGAHLVKVAKEEGQLVLRWQKPQRNDQIGSWPKLQARVLLDDVDEFALAYRSQFGGPWLNNWNSREVPGWVRLRIQVSSRFWPDLIVRVAE